MRLPWVITPPPCLDIEIVGSNYICYTGSKLYSLKDFLGIVNWYTSPNGIDYDFVGVGSTMLITANEPSMFLYIKIESTSGSFCGKRQISVPECLDDPQTEERDGNMITNSSDFNFVSIFPNPTNSSLSISGLLDSQSILLYDISGHLITSKTGDFGDHLDLSNLPKGFYFLKVSGLKNQNVFKIIKE